MKKLLAVFLCLVSGAAVQNSIYAQSYLYQTGNPQFSTQIPIENGFINVNNGDIHIEIPLAANAQRGNLQLNERLIYDSRIWKLVSNGGVSWQPTNVPNSVGGWVFSSGVQSGTYSFISAQETAICDGAAGFGYTIHYKFTWTDSQGTTHPFSDTAQTQELQSGGPHCLNYSGPIKAIPTATAYATDGSGYFAAVSNYETLTVYDRQGNQYNPTFFTQTPSLNSKVIDANGNYWSQDASGNLIDTVGRTPVKVSKSGNLTFFDVLGEGGVNRRYTLTTETISFNTSFNQPGVAESAGSFTGVQSIQLPDGSSYSFTYDSGTAPGNYGELTSVTLPTGGVIQYGYTNFLDSFQNQNRWVHTRIKDGGTTTFTPATISRCTATQGCQETVTVTSPPDNISPSGNDTVYTFTLDNGSYLDGGSWNSGIDAYQGLASGGGKLKSLNTAYTYAQLSYVLNVNGVGVTAGNYEVPSTVTTQTVSPSGLTSQTITTMDFSGGLPTSIKEWDYYPSGAAPASPTRETDSVYSYLGNGLTLPTQVTIKDGAGNQIAQTSYVYDETTGSGHAALAPVASIPQEPLPVTGSRGNLTTTSRWLNTTGALISSMATYDSAGAILSSTDPNGTTTYGHDSTDTFVTQVTRPTTSGVQHISTSVYDPSTGLMTRSDDESSYAQGSIHPTLYTYESALNRIQSVTYPDGGQTSYAYPSAREMDSTRLATPDPSIASQAISDSYGRPFQVVQAGVSSETSYDLNGRVFCITNPHFVGSSSTTDGSTCTTQYDGLSRPVLQTQPDGSTLGWLYRGNVTTSTDEGGHSWQQTTDALGRLINVTEPTGASTGYIYDVLNNLRTMNQLGLPGEVPRVRGFVYDSLSRLTSATNPESGTVGYGYDANGNMIGKTDARGVTTTFVYDLLNRLTAKTSSDGSVHYEYLYDVSGAPNGVGRLSHSSNDINAAAARSYDAMGRIIKQQYCIPSDCPSYSSQVSAQYDLAGNLISLTYPDGRVVNQRWDSGGHLSSVTDAVGTQYLTPQSTYNPDGSSLTIWRGNGVASGFERNSRQQPWAWNVARIDANAPGNRGLLLKEACYGPATPSPSPNAVPACPSFGIGNNGNIWSIIDGSVSGHTQTYSYDSLNRLSTMIQADAGMQQTYQYDSFGNLNQVFPATLGGSVGVLPNNQIQGIGYDGAGNAAVYDNGLFTTTYAYDAENQLTNVNNGVAVYTYDADGNRVRKDTGGEWTEYIHFNGQTMAEKNDDGTWSDYIFANGQRLARADNYDIRIRMSGTNCSGCSSTNTFAGTVALTNANGTVIRPGDLLTWRQYQDGVGRGGISVAFNNSTIGSSGVLRALDNELADADTRTNNWYQRVADLSPYVGLTVSGLNLYNYQGGPPGNWDIYLGDISLVHTDGTFVRIYDRTMMGLAQFTPGAAESNVSVITEKLPNSFDPLNTAYYHYDQVGSVLFMTDPGGWPISSDSYYPFGQAGGPVPLATPGIGDHYNFTGQERDSESALYNFNARYYLPALGRFMSPDPYNGSFDLSNPQSFNRYVYVNNRPLTSTDPTGLFILPAGPGGPASGVLCPVCGGIIAGAGAIYDLGKLFGWWGGSGFHGTLTPRPEGTGTPDWNNPWNEHIGLPAGGPAFGGGGLGGLLGLSSAGCEFGACDIGAISSFASGVGSLASAGSCLSSSFGLPGAGGGAITIASLPTLSTGVKIGESPTVGTSILSTTMRALLPQRNFGSIWAPTIGNLGSRTPVLGGAVSRWAGWVGVAVTTYQTGKFINCLKGGGGGSPGIGGGGASGGAGASGDWFH